MQVFAAITLLLASAEALYFYTDGSAPKCFLEEYAKGTMVVGTYKATQWNDQSRSYIHNPEMGIHITADETFDNDHRVVSQRGASEGKFAFSAAESGTHRLCFTPTNVPATSGFLFSGSPSGGVKIELDMAIGETSSIESSDKSQMDQVVSKVQDLVLRLQDIRREQIFQREREAEFRDQSEAVNARVVRWSIIQLIVLAATCAWQLTYLRAFFIKQKLT
ncbi:transmembrane emp24 domain-containing protein [Piedraia hortae CBS 480.64]|uniref:Transmembrane emp24 domain-containing protein n=1 Tax=Piedraia hortae CBS 480.64 TaxID=1314780 RepID=A0A6A7CA61_9PEZI|nr:transmembrane emp24 domain-containing protein [Piedraia hortae CBS 480.64]